MRLSAEEVNAASIPMKNYRQRSGAAGWDTMSVDLIWQQGWVSYRGAKRFAGKQGKSDIDADSLNQYFEEHGRLEGAAPRRIRAAPPRRCGTVDRYRGGPLAGGACDE